MAVEWVHNQVFPRIDTIVSMLREAPVRGFTGVQKL
jgi:hypothetical protein